MPTLEELVKMKEYAEGKRKAETNNTHYDRNLKEEEMIADAIFEWISSSDEEEGERMDYFIAGYSSGTGFVDTYRATDGYLYYRYGVKIEDTLGDMIQDVRDENDEMSDEEWEKLIDDIVKTQKEIKEEEKR